MYEAIFLSFVALGVFLATYTFVKTGSKFFAAVIVAFCAFSVTSGEIVPLGMFGAATGEVFVGLFR